MKKSLALLMAMVMILSLALAGCAKSDADSVIKLGVIGPMTGDYSMYGTAVAEGAKLAAKEINAAGGVNGATIDIIAYDSKGDKTEAVNAYNRLRDQDGIKGLIGGTFSGETLAIKEIAVGDNMPVLTPTATHSDVTLNAPNVFRACYTDPYQGATAAKFATEQLGAKTAAVLYNIEDAYSDGLANAFNTKFAELGTITDFEGYTTKDADFKAVLTKIADKDPDVIFLPDYTAKVGVILSQIKELGIDVIAIGGDGWDGIEADYADVAEGHYFANHYAKTDSAQIVQDFIAAYEKEYGKTPSALAALGYDSTYIMAQAMEKAKSTEAQKVVDALAKTDGDYVTGHITFDANGDPVKSISIIQIVNGEHKLAAKVSGE
ncbi:MAG: amino acid-binding protein [Clostridiales bacterium 38-18]|nr:MAG: amino acid-binding protein [Clostridiales bacterium 38-18]